MSEMLSTPKISPIDGVYAELLGLGSVVINAFPKKANFVGKAETKSYTSVHWHHLRQPYDRNRGSWLHYDGIRGSGITPANYGAIAIIEVDRESFDNLINRQVGVPVLAYRLGSTVMFGESSKHKILGLEKEHDDYYKTAMRIGKGGLEVQAAALTLDLGPMISQIKREYEPFKGDIRKGPVISEAELPDWVPLI